MYFDMESRGIEFVALKYKLPCLILKIPFDFIGKREEVSEKNYKEFGGKIGGLLKNQSYNKYLKKILDWIKNS
jgi:formate hydrogenlyase subunit 4